MNKLIEGITNPKVKEIMVRFFEAADKLYDDMDSLSYEEFKVRSKAMWSIRNEAAELGDYFLITLGGISNKADKLYGKMPM